MYKAQTNQELPGIRESKQYDENKSEQSIKSNGSLSCNSPGRHIQPIPKVKAY